MFFIDVFPNAAGEKEAGLAGETAAGTTKSPKSPKSSSFVLAVEPLQLVGASSDQKSAEAGRVGLGTDGVGFMEEGRLWILAGRAGILVGRAGILVGRVLILVGRVLILVGRVLILVGRVGILGGRVGILVGKKEKLVNSCSPEVFSRLPVEEGFSKPKKGCYENSSTRIDHFSILNPSPGKNAKIITQTFLVR